MGFIGWHALGQSHDTLGVRIRVGGGLGDVGHRLVNRHPLQHHAHVFQQRTGRQTQLTENFAGVHYCQAIALGQRFNEGEDMAAVDAAEHVANGGLLQFAIAKCNRLVGEGQGIAHRAACSTRNQTQGLHIGHDFFIAQHLTQVLDDGFGRHRA